MSRRFPAKVPLTPAQQELAAANTGLAYWHADRFCRRTRMDYDECVGAALLGLVNAARLFRPELGWRFSTYASWSIRNTLARELEVERRRPDRLAVRLSGGTQPHSEWGDRRTGETFDEPAAPEGPPPYDRETERAVADAVRALPPRERAVVRMRFYEGRKLAEAGAALGVTRERARQLQAQALRRVREAVGVGAG